MTHPDRSAQSKRQLLRTTIFISALAFARILFCFQMPEVIGGWNTFKIDGDALIISLPFLIMGYYILFHKNYLRSGLIVIAPGLCLLGSVSAFHAQIAVFHFGQSYSLIDGSLGHIDSLLLFEWREYFEWMIAHDAYRWLVSLAYQSIWVQPLMLSALFILGRHVSSFLVIQLSLPLSLTLTCAIAAFLPALGAYQFHGMNPHQHAHVALEFTDQMTAPMMWLRQAELPGVMPHFQDLRLITFPSWHAAAATIFIGSSWSIGRIRYFFVALNVAMLLATPVQGSHYLTDIIVGSFVGLLSQIVSIYLLRLRPAAGSDRDYGAPKPAQAFA